jgi:hypothetical protein
MLGGSFDRGLEVLEGAIAIGRQAEEVGVDQVRSRMDAVRPTPSAKAPVRSKFTAWLGLVGA